MNNYTKNRQKTQDIYSQIIKIMDKAFNRAAKGKGKERHGQDTNSFLDQPMFMIMDTVGTGFATGQALKKITEAQHMEESAAENELLDSIVYLACSYIHDNKQIFSKNYSESYESLKQVLTNSIKFDKSITIKDINCILGFSYDDFVQKIIDNVSNPIKIKYLIKLIAYKIIQTNIIKGDI